MAERDLPYGAFNFLVEIDGIEAGGFSDVSGLGTELTVAEYRNGNDRVNHTSKVPMLHKATDVTLKRGLINSETIWAWFKEAHSQGPSAKRNVSVTLQDESQNRVQAWLLRGCLPMKYTGPTLAAKGGEDVAMEELVLSIEAFDIQG